MHQQRLYSMKNHWLRKHGQGPKDHWKLTLGEKCKQIQKERKEVYETCPPHKLNKNSEFLLDVGILQCWKTNCHSCETRFGPAGRTGSSGTQWHNRAGFAIEPLIHVTRDDPTKPSRFCGNPVTRPVLKTRIGLCTLKKIMGVQKVYPHSFCLLENWTFGSFCLLKTGLMF